MTGRGIPAIGNWRGPRLQSQKVSSALLISLPHLLTYHSAILRKPTPSTLILNPNTSILDDDKGITSYLSVLYNIVQSDANTHDSFAADETALINEPHHVHWRASTLERLRTTIMCTNTISREEESSQTLRLMTTASSPATGPSTPTALRTIPLDQLKVADDDEEEIIPPARPSSTPFPQQETLEGEIQCIPRSNDLDLQIAAKGLKRRYESDHSIDTDVGDATASQRPDSTLSALCNLPVEIQDCILDYLFGFRNSASVSTKSPSGQSKVLRNWSNALRHARRREVSDLSLVSKNWRHLIQDRLYRHIKIKATRDSVDDAKFWFLCNPHLRPYVKHIEFWFPVFQQRPMDNRTLRIPIATITTARSSLIPNMGLASVAEEPIPTLTYQSPNNNCTLEEVFEFAQLTFSDACVLTLEGGDRKKPPKVRHFARERGSRSLPVLETINTLVCKGMWNIIRTNEDFQTIVAALPKLTEMHGSYAKPKSKSYLCMSTILPNLPYHLTNINICLENDFRREAVSPAFFRKVVQNTHFCVEMAKSIPTLEHFQYTGRVCRSFFDVAAGLSNSRTSRLKSIDLVVKNVCRPQSNQWNHWNDGSGITDMAFIHAFEALVHAGVRSLDRLPALESLKIKFIDLGKFPRAPNPQLSALTHPRLHRAQLEPLFPTREQQVHWNLERSDHRDPEQNAIWCKLRRHLRLPRRSRTQQGRHAAQPHPLQEAATEHQSIQLSLALGRHHHYMTSPLNIAARDRI